jgi:hypothetical protein
MDNQAKRAFALLISLLLFASLACGLGGIDLPEVGGLPEGAAATAEGAARAAATAVAQVTIPAGAMATAEAMAGRAGDVMATAAAIAGDEGSQLVSTLEAGDFNVDVGVNVDALREKIANATPDANGNLTITFTEAEINEALTLRQGNGNTQGLRDPQLSFTQNTVILTGGIDQPIAGSLEATFRPYVVDGERSLALELTAAKINGIAVPTILLGTLEATVNTSLDLLMSNLPQAYELRQVTVGEGTLTIVATRVN